MAQAPRSNTSPAPTSDDPLENATIWIQANSKSLIIGIVGAAVVAAGIFGYRYLNEQKMTEAAAALYQAQGPLMEGQLPQAQLALQRVATKYSGTSAGQQASMLLGQVLYDLNQFQGGITELEKAVSTSSSDNRAAFYALIAAGHEGMGNLEKAAEAYGQAAGAATTTPVKQQNLVSQARSLMLAGKMDEAKTIFTDLAEDSNSAYAQEARVRLGEIAGATVK